MKLTKLFIVLLLLVSLPVVLSNCKKEAKLCEPLDPESFVNFELKSKIEDVKGYYADALVVVNKNGTNFKNAGEKIQEIEKLVVVQCTKNFGQEFEKSYQQLKSQTQLGNKSDIVVSEYFKESFKEINLQFAGLFDAEATPSEEEMIEALSTKIEDLKMMIASDFQFNHTEKSNLINALTTHSALLTTTFDIVNIALQDLDDKNQFLKCWICNAWTAVSNFAVIVFTYATTGAVLSGGNAYAIIGTAIVGLGAATYCSIYGMNHCVCNIWRCFFEATA
jgi:hypothetical protein